MERPIVDLCEQLMERMRGHGFELSSPVPLSREEMRAALRPWVTQPELVDDDVVDWFAYWWNDELALPRYSFLFPGDPMDRTYYEPYWHYHRQNLLSNNPPGPGFPNPELILPIDEYDLAFFSVVAPRPDDGKWVLYNWAMDGHDGLEPLFNGEITTLRQLLTMQILMHDAGYYIAEGGGFDRQFTMEQYAVLKAQMLAEVGDN